MCADHQAMVVVMMIMMIIIKIKNSNLGQESSVGIAPR
jgi:hypothetical protein